MLKIMMTNWQYRYQFSKETLRDAVEEKLNIAATTAKEEQTREHVFNLTKDYIFSALYLYITVMELFTNEVRFIMLNFIVQSLSWLGEKFVKSVIFSLHGPFWKLFT